MDKLQRNYIQNTTDLFNKNAFENVACKIWAILSRSHWIKVFHLEAVQSSHLDAVFQNTHKINHLQATSVILIFNVVAEHLIKPSTLFFVSKLLIGYSLFLSIVFSCVSGMRGIGILLSVCPSADHTLGFHAFPCKPLIRLSSNLAEYHLFSALLIILSENFKNLSSLGVAMKQCITNSVFIQQNERTLCLCTHTVILKRKSFVLGNNMSSQLQTVLLRSVLLC